MKKTTITSVISICFVTLIFVSSTLVNAAAGSPTAIGLTPSPSSAPADGSSKITIDTYSFYYKCNSGDYAVTKSECDAYDPSGYSGQDVTKGSETTYLSGDAELVLSQSTITTSSSGHATFTVTSSKVGTFNVYAKTLSGYVQGQRSITFTNPNPPAPAAPKPAPAPSSAPAQVTAPKKPDTPSVKLVDNEGNDLIQKSEDDKIIFKQSEPVVLSGVTIPNGLVKLYIFSDPQEASVTADKDGNWKYTIENLEPGDHRVEAEVVDPSSGTTSDRQQVLAFQVAEATTPDEEVFSAAAVDDKSSAIGPILAVLALAVLGTGGYVLWRRKQARSKQLHSPADNDLSMDDKAETVQPEESIDNDSSQNQDNT